MLCRLSNSTPIQIIVFRETTPLQLTANFLKCWCTWSAAVMRPWIAMLSEVCFSLRQIAFSSEHCIFKSRSQLCLKCREWKANSTWPHASFNRTLETVISMCCLFLINEKCSVDTQSLMGDGWAFTLSDKQKHDVFHPSNCKHGNVFTI